MAKVGAKKGAPCSVCRDQRRHQIEIGLVHGMSLRDLAKRFDLSHHAIGRHARNHLTPQVRAAILAAQKPSEVDLDALRTSEAEGILSQLVVQRARLQQHLDRAAQVGDLKACVAVEAAIGKNLELTGKLLGQLVTHHDVRHSNILITPDYLRMRAVIVDALRPYPEAARAVGAALHRLESDAAKDITAAATKPKAPVVIDHQPAGQGAALPPPPPLQVTSC